MTHALEPEQALDHLAAITAGVEAMALLDGEGSLLAGDPVLAGRQEGTQGATIERAGDHVLAVRRARAPRSLEALVRHDMREALALLGASASGAAADRR
jgi:hypothetical protein